MTLTIEIPAEVQVELAAQARANDMDVPTYVATLLERAARPPLTEAKDRSRGGEFEKTLDRIAQFSHKMPVLPAEAFSREDLYQDHD